MQRYYRIFKNINKTVVFPRLIWPFFLLFLFSCQQYIHFFHYLQVEFFISFLNSKFYIMSSITSQSSPAFHQFINKEKTSTETATKLNFISSIWDDDHIRRLDVENWQCLWCNQTFQKSMLLRLLFTY